MKYEISDGIYSVFNFDAKKAPKCKNCGREKESHQAKTMNCPGCRGSFPWFMKDQVYEPKQQRNKRKDS